MKYIFYFQKWWLNVCLNNDFIFHQKHCFNSHITFCYVRWNACVIQFTKFQAIDSNRIQNDVDLGKANVTQRSVCFLRVALLFDFKKQKQKMRITSGISVENIWQWCLLPWQRVFLYYFYFICLNRHKIVFGKAWVCFCLYNHCVLTEMWQFLMMRHTLVFYCLVKQGLLKKKTCVNDFQNLHCYKICLNSCA